MITFLVVAAVMVAGALLVVLPPLVARRKAESYDRAAANIVLLRQALEDNDAELRAGSIDQAQWEQTKREIERRAVEESEGADMQAAATASAERSPIIALVIGLLLPMAAGLMYVTVGEPRALSGKPPAAEESDAHAMQAAQIQGMADRLAEKLKSTPDDAEGWVTLGRTYAYLDRLPEALSAIEKAIKLMPKDARLLADYADMYAASHGSTLEGEPEKFIKRALEIDPNQPKALALAGTIAYNKRDFQTAAKHWERAVSALPPDSPFAQQLNAGLAEVREKLGQKAPPAATTPPAAAKAGAGTLSGTVTLAPALAKQAGPDDTVFVFARLPEGGAPLAVVRAKVSELPLKFNLDDSMSMSKDNRLSAAPRVIIAARVTKTGNVTPQKGDFEGMSTPVTPGTSGITVRIEKER